MINTLVSVSFSLLQLSALLHCDRQLGFVVGPRGDVLCTDTDTQFSAVQIIKQMHSTAHGAGTARTHRSSS